MSLNGSGTCHLQAEQLTGKTLQSSVFSLAIVTKNVLKGDQSITLGP